MLFVPGVGASSAEQSSYTFTFKKKSHISMTATHLIKETLMMIMVTHAHNL